jgi:tRNA(Ile)-lysidine synthase
LKAHSIVLGHQQNDQAETVLLRLLRGAGISGLAAMAELGPGRLLRPLLSLNRRVILAYLAAIGANYVVDSSNLDAGALRNRVRARLLPYIERAYSPGLSRRLAELAGEMREFESFIVAEAGRSLDERLVPAADISQNATWRLNVRGFKSVSRALAQAELRELIKRAVGDLRRIERVHIEAMWGLAAGDNPAASLVLPRGWRFRREYDTVVLEHGPAPNGKEPAAGRGEVELMPGANLLSASGFTLMLQEVEPHEPRFPAAPWHPPNRFEAYFDAVKAPVLSVRCVRAGDRIEPLGLCGSRKIHDIFVDHKVTVANRGSWPLVVSDNKVVWIPGLVRSAVALVTAASRKVLHLRADLPPGGQRTLIA